MSGAANTPSVETPIPEFKQVLGHPAPLWMLFMTEFWERFAFYGIRWAMVLYIVAQFYSGAVTGEEPASHIYGAYLALVYAAAIFGGYVADRILGYQRSILLGAVIMASGLFMISMSSELVFSGIFTCQGPLQEMELIRLRQASCARHRDRREHCAAQTAPGLGPEWRDHCSAGCHPGHRGTASNYNGGRRQAR